MRALRIGISARFGYGDAKLRGGLTKNNYCVEQAVAGWVQAGGALAFLIPDATAGPVRLASYAGELDGLVLQGGSDISPANYGETPLKPEWAGDAALLDGRPILEEFLASCASKIPPTAR